MILCDSGPLIAAAVRNDVHYDECTRLFTGLRLAGRRLLVPATVVAEVGYMLEQRVGPTVEAAFLQAVADGAFELISLEPGDLGRMAQLVAKYDDLPLGTTDASLIDYNGSPSSLIEGTYRQNEMTLNTSRRHVIVKSGPDKYLVSLAVTTEAGGGVGEAQATDGIVNGFRAGAPGSNPPAPPPPVAVPPAVVAPPQALAH